MKVTLAVCGMVFSAACFAQVSADPQRAACQKMSDADERRACLREVGAARAEAKRNGLADSGDYQKNLTARCNYLPSSDREDCERRMRGEGTVSGSVEGGGIYRELRTIVPGEEAGSGATK